MGVYPPFFPKKLTARKPIFLKVKKMEEEFILSLPPQLQRDLVENQKYAYFNPDVIFSDEKKKRETEAKTKELKKLELDLKILQEQEGGEEVNTEAEETAVSYWETSLTNHLSDCKNVKYLENQIEAVKTKYEATLRDLETKLELAKQSNLSKEIFFRNRLESAEKNLERKRETRSYPRIRLERKIEDLKAYLEKDQAAFRGYMKLQEAKTEMEKLYKEWKANKEKQAKASATIRPRLVGEKKKSKTIVKSATPPVFELEADPSSYHADVENLALASSSPSDRAVSPPK